MSTTTMRSDRRPRSRSPEAIWPGVMATGPNAAATVARLALGAMILPHGLQKTVGAFGGPGFAGTMAYFTETLGIPWVLASVAIATELFGGLALLAGLAGRVAAAGVGALMVVAAAISHLQHGFFMNWFGAMPAGAEGWEFHLLAVALAAVVILRGSGAWSLDRALTRREAPGPDGRPGA